MLDEFEFILSQEETRLTSEISAAQSQSETPEKVTVSESTQVHPNSRHCGKCFNCTKANCGQCAACRNDVEPNGEFLTNVCFQKVCAGLLNFYSVY
jgi:hypothetical protein